MQTYNLQQDRVHWPSVLQLGFSLAAAMACWSLAVTFALGGIAQVFGKEGISEGTASFFLLAAGAGLSGLLLLPSAGYALLHLLNRPYPFVARIEAFSRRFFRPALLIFLLPLVLLLGHLVSQRAQIAWLILPILHILAVGLPILWLGTLGRRGLPQGSNQRAWGVFGTGLILGPGLILILEIAVLGLILALGIVYILLNPELVEELNTLAFRLSFVRSSSEDVLRLISPYLTRPLVLFMIFAYTTIIVPLIEEFFKPVGVWLFVGGRITPAEGFVAGMLSGIGYALFENLALSTMAGGSWTEIVVSRIGTGLLHIITPALTGWALALAWEEGRYLRLGLTYLGAVFVHGLWNSLALLTAAENFSPAGAASSLDFTIITRISSAGLGLIALAMFAVLLVSNMALRRAEEQKLRSENEHGVNHEPDRSDLTPG